MSQQHLQLLDTIKGAAGRQHSPGIDRALLGDLIATHADLRTTIEQAHLQLGRL